MSDSATPWTAAHQAPPSQGFSRQEWWSGPKVDVVVEFAGKQIVAKEVKDAVLKAYKKANKGVEIKTVEIYIKPEENAAYYVVNGDAKPEYKVEL